jgi:shikimate kinase
MRLSDWASDAAIPARWYLWGMPYSGKSSVGIKLKNKLPFPVLDLDKRIEEKQGVKIAELFSRFGEETFRDMEQAELKQVTAEYSSFFLVCGGGTPCFKDNAEWMLQHGETLFLHTAMDQLITRASVSRGEERPLLKNTEKEQALKEVWGNRKSDYEKARFIAFSEKEIVDCFLRKYHCI